MSDLRTSDLDRIHELLLSPTAENVLRVTVQLESLIGDVAKARSAIASGEPDQELHRQFILDIRTKMLQIRNLLNTAARFYSGLSARTSPSYERHGLMFQADSPRRPLARL